MITRINKQEAMNIGDNFELKKKEFMKIFNNICFVLQN